MGPTFPFTFVCNSFVKLHVESGLFNVNVACASQGMNGKTLKDEERKRTKLENYIHILSQKTVLHRFLVQIRSFSELIDFIIFAFGILRGIQITFEPKHEHL